MGASHLEVFSVVIVDNSKDDVHIHKKADYQKCNKENNIVWRCIKCWHPEKIGEKTNH